MSEQNWGIGNAKDKKAFAIVSVKGENYELVHGEHPHSRQDNNTYARNGKFITGFDGHKLPFKIEIEEFNYLKSSEYSGDEIRKGGNVKVFCDNIQVYDEFCRSYQMGYLKAQNFILEMEEYWGWFPRETDDKINTIVGYKNTLCKITSFVISQSCVILETVDGKPFPQEIWEDDEDYEKETSVKVEIHSNNLCWFPKNISK